MGNTKNQYLLADNIAELERLRLQAEVWKPDAEVLLHRIGIQPGWNCVDLGCGTVGILESLSQRVGVTGTVVGVDLDASQVAVAREFLREEGCENVEVVEGDAFCTNLPRQSFDLTHARFMFAPLGRDQELLREMLDLTKPGGVVAIQEPDASSWNYYPSNPAWECLKSAILASFKRGGGDFNAGQRTFALLRGSGLEDVQIRVAAIALHNEHPYKRLPIQFVSSLRHRILDVGWLTEWELDNALAACEAMAHDPGTVFISFTLTQVWGKKPR
jgi:ubiquinone/menaquinone biosynthesis C-methylase UbiE